MTIKRERQKLNLSEIRQVHTRLSEGRASIGKPLPPHHAIAVQPPTGRLNLATLFAGTVGCVFTTSTFRMPVASASPFDASIRQNSSAIIPVTRLDSTNLSLLVKTPFHVVVQSDGYDGFIASYFDANINASGDTQEEAVRNLKETIAMTWELYRANEPNLGDSALDQLNALRQVVGD